MDKRILGIGFGIFIIICVIIASYSGYIRARNDLLFNPEKHICDVAVSNNALISLEPRIEEVECIHIGLSGIGQGLFCVNETLTLPIRCIQWHNKNDDSINSDFNSQKFYAKMDN